MNYFLPFSHAELVPHGMSTSRMANFM